MRVVLDTSVIVSAFLTPSGPRAQLLQGWQRQQYEPLVSEAILAEYQRALMYEEVATRHGMSAEEVAEVIEGLRSFAVVVEPTERLAVIREDPGDDKFLECAVTGGAEYVISGDPHLLRLQEYQGIQILSPREFLVVLEEQRGQQP